MAAPGGAHDRPIILEGGLDINREVLIDTGVAMLCLRGIGIIDVSVMTTGPIGLLHHSAAAVV